MRLGLQGTPCVPRTTRYPLCALKYEVRLMCLLLPLCALDYKVPLVCLGIQGTSYVPLITLVCLGIRGTPVCLGLQGDHCAYYIPWTIRCSLCAVDYTTQGGMGSVIIALLR